MKHPFTLNVFFALTSGCVTCKWRIETYWQVNLYHNWWKLRDQWMWKDHTNFLFCSGGAADCRWSCCHSTAHRQKALGVWLTLLRSTAYLSILIRCFDLCTFSLGWWLYWEHPEINRDSPSVSNSRDCYWGVMQGLLALKLFSFARPYLVLLASTVNGYEGQAKIAKGLQMDVRLVYNLLLSSRLKWAR